MPNYVRGSGKEVIFRDFAPDLDPTTPGIILDANSAVPTMKGYMARNAPIAIPNGVLSHAPVGSYMALFPGTLPGFNPTARLYAAAGGHVYQLQSGGGGWLDAGGGSVFPAGSGRWRFTQFNNDVIATVASGDVLLANGAAGIFAPIPGLPVGLASGAETVISVGGFVVLFSGSNWFSSAAGSDTNFTPNIQTLAATGTLYDVPGDITAAATLYRSIIAFKAGGTWVGTFSGAPFTWSFQLISGQTGTYGQECVVTLPDSIAFLGTDDFYVTTGYTPQRIPNSCKEWFFLTVDRSQLQNVIGWYDPINSVVYWHFTSLASPSPTILDRFVAWNTRVGRWSTGYLNASFVVPNTQDSPVQLFGGNGGSCEGGYFFDPTFAVSTWDSGAGAVPGTMYVKSGYLGDEDNLSELFRFRAKWNVYPNSDSAQAWRTNILGKPPIFDAAIVKSGSDWYNCRQYDRWHQIQINSIGPAEIVGYAFEARVGGTR